MCAEARNPDVEEEYQTEGIQIVWLQKRSCESWPALHWNCSIDMSQYDPAELTTECEDEDTGFDPRDDGGGCVINDGVAGPCEYCVGHCSGIFPVSLSSMSL